MEFQRHFQRHRWLLAIVACSLLILASIAALAGCSTPGSQGDTNGTSAQSSPTIKTTPPPLANGTPSHQALLAGGFAAGHMTQITVTPASAICNLSQNIVPDASYHVVIHYNSGHTLTFTELVKPPTPG
jgi:hypothetical protein